MFLLGRYFLVYCVKAIQYNTLLLSFFHLSLSLLSTPPLHFNARACVWVPKFEFDCDFSCNICIHEVLSTLFCHSMFTHLVLSSSLCRPALKFIPADVMFTEFLSFLPFKYKILPFPFLSFPSPSV